MPRHARHHNAFDKLMNELSDVIMKNVADAVAKATGDNLTERIAEAAKTAADKFRRKGAMTKAPAPAARPPKPRKRAAKKQRPPADPAMAGKPGYSKYGRKLGRPGKGKA
jgi:hypothetical protein